MIFFKPILKYFITAPMSDYIFYIIMIIVAILSKFCYKKRELLINSIAAIGMIGTFYGICIGLQNFDANNITKSVPELLSGMKTAFYTSLIGTMSSVALKILYGLFGTKMEPVEEEFFDNNTLIRKQNNKIILLLENLIEKQSEIINCNSNIKNLYNLQQENANRFMILFDDKLNKTNELLETNINEFKFFKEKMAKENNEAFVEALNSCIKSLNKDLMEQLGENFNKFNEGMFRLVEWQDKYVNIIKNTEKTHENIANTFTIIEERLTSSVNAIEKLSSYSEKIMSICDNVEKIISSLENTISDTTESKERLITISEKIINLNDDLIIFKDSLGSIIKDIENNKNLFKESYDLTNNKLETLNKDLENYSQNVNEAHNNFNNNMRKELNNAVNNINELNVKFNSDCIRIVENISNEMNSLNKEVGKLLEKHINNIEEKLGESLTASLESLGDEMASLSEKFAEDYTPLTNKLREIVRLSEKVK